jgi:2-polyprenyl-3-methyl-5-hydroxy-6-metoxy-1,4-benzoquinol methylase
VEEQTVENQFAKIALIYDRIFLRDLEADRSMLVTLLARYGAKTVLDCACGTGVHTLILAREGFQTVASDASDHMLEAARAKLSAAGFEVDLYRSTWRDLPEVVPGRYDAVICMGNSLAHEPDAAAATESLRGMYAMLNVGGILLLSGTNADRQLSEKIGLEVVEPEPDCFLMNVWDYGETRTTSRYFFIDTVSGEPSMRYFKFELLNLTAAIMESCLRSAGIDDYTLYGEKDYTPYSQYESERLIVVARKGNGVKGTDDEAQGGVRKLLLGRGPSAASQADNGFAQASIWQG